MQFGGDFTVAAPFAPVWAALLDAETLATCVPGVESVRQTGPDTYAGNVKVRLGPIASSFELAGTVDAREAERTYRVDVGGRERLTGTVADGRFSATLTEATGSTTVAWELDLNLRGRLGQMGQAVFQDVARKMTKQTIECLRDRLEAGG